MPPTEEDLKLLGVAPDRVAAALAAWDEHPIDWGKMRCKCGAAFEATLLGNQRYQSHRMQAAIFAGIPEHTRNAVRAVSRGLGFTLELRAGVWVIAYPSGGARPAQTPEIKLWEMLIETIEKLQESDEDALPEDEPAKVYPDGWCTCGMSSMRFWRGDDGALHGDDCPRVVSPPTCKACSSRLKVDVVRISELKVFCPNSDCVEWVQGFWIER